eukprot:ANDGO_01587.mRNA.1 hypothetical protein
MPYSAGSTSASSARVNLFLLCPQSSIALFSSPKYSEQSIRRCCHVLVTCSHDCVVFPCTLQTPRQHSSTFIPQTQPFVFVIPASAFKKLEKFMLDREGVVRRFLDYRLKSSASASSVGSNEKRTLGAHQEEGGLVNLAACTGLLAKCGYAQIAEKDELMSRGIEALLSVLPRMYDCQFWSSSAGILYHPVVRMSFDRWNGPSSLFPGIAVMFPDKKKKTTAAPVEKARSMSIVITEGDDKIAMEGVLNDGNTSFDQDDDEMEKMPRPMDTEDLAEPTSPGSQERIVANRPLRKTFMKPPVLVPVPAGQMQGVSGGGTLASVHKRPVVSASSASAAISIEVVRGTPVTSLDPPPKSSSGGQYLSVFSRASPSGSLPGSFSGSAHSLSPGMDIPPIADPMDIDSSLDPVPVGLSADGKTGIHAGPISDGLLSGGRVFSPSPLTGVGLNSFAPIVDPSFPGDRINALKRIAIGNSMDNAFVKSEGGGMESVLDSFYSDEPKPDPPKSFPSLSPSLPQVRSEPKAVERPAAEQAKMRMQETKRRLEDMKRRLASRTQPVPASSGSSPWSLRSNNHSVEPVNGPASYSDPSLVEKFLSEGSLDVSREYRESVPDFSSLQDHQPNGLSHDASSLSNASVSSSFQNMSTVALSRLRDIVSAGSETDYDHDFKIRSISPKLTSNSNCNSPHMLSEVDGPAEKSAAEYEMSVSESQEWITVLESVQASSVMYEQDFSSTAVLSSSSEGPDFGNSYSSWREKAYKISFASQHIVSVDLLVDDLLFSPEPPSYLQEYVDPRFIESNGHECSITRLYPPNILCGLKSDYLAVFPSIVPSWASSNIQPFAPPVSSEQAHLLVVSTDQTFPDYGLVDHRQWESSLQFFATNVHGTFSDCCFGSLRKRSSVLCTGALASSGSTSSNSSASSLQNLAQSSGSSGASDPLSSSVPSKILAVLQKVNIDIKNIIEADESGQSPVAGSSTTSPFSSSSDVRTPSAVPPSGGVRKIGILLLCSEFDGSASYFAEEESLISYWKTKNVWVRILHIRPQEVLFHTSQLSSTLRRVSFELFNALQGPPFVVDDPVHCRLGLQSTQLFSKVMFVAYSFQKQFVCAVDDRGEFRLRFTVKPTQTGVHTASAFVEGVVSEVIKHWKSALLSSMRSNTRWTVVLTKIDDSWGDDPALFTERFLQADASVVSMIDSIQFVSIRPSSVRPFALTLGTAKMLHETPYSLVRCPSLLGLHRGWIFHVNDHLRAASIRFPESDMFIASVEVSIDAVFSVSRFSGETVSLTRQLDVDSGLLDSLAQRILSISFLDIRYSDAQRAYLLPYHVTSCLRFKPCQPAF